MTKPIIQLLLLCLAFSVVATKVSAVSAPWWQFQAVDTMKYSRDLSGLFLADRVALKETSETQVAAIADLGATHVAIATPYDEEFLPVLKEWIAAARRHGLKVWFRGNWSGWEEWFDHSPITRAEHLAKTVEFIQKNPDLFENGDFFSACPECENGGPGDPRQTGDIAGHREFLIDEHDAMLVAFRSINKNVQVSMNSMNGDVARAIMDKQTTQALGGVVVIDHYVRTPEQLNKDVTDFAEQTGGRVILGEFGVPIPDIHGAMDQDQQAEWLSRSLTLIAENPNLDGLSYWTNQGGSTALWTEGGEPKKAVGVVKNFFSPRTINGIVVTESGKGISAAMIRTERQEVTSKDKGNFFLPYLSESEVATISAAGYTEREIPVSILEKNSDIILFRDKTGWWDQLYVRLLDWFKWWMSNS